METEGEIKTAELPPMKLLYIHSLISVGYIFVK